MKRDMDLCRKILLKIENHGQVMGVMNIKVEGYTEKEISYHVMLLSEVDLIEALDMSDRSGHDWKPQRLTWEGHEFLEASRNDNIWENAKRIITEKTGGVTFDVLKALLLDLVKKSVLG